jgi:predicted membrane-bound spermidine synthase
MTAPLSKITLPEPAADTQPRALDLPSDIPRAAGDEILVRWMPLLFCVSGFSALIYQVVWQRVLFAAFGVNVEAVTVVVTAFLAGLGLGSLLGGWLARAEDRFLLRGFGSVEIAIGAFGLVSVEFFRWIGDLSLGLASPERAILLALIVMVPTTMMGVTLPLLVGYLVRASGNVGRSVGTLYFVNTAGSALAAFAAVFLLLGNLGEAKSAMLAGLLNLAIGGMVIALSTKMVKTA